MSGRWRSRHWRSGEGSDQQQTQQIRPRSSSRERRRHGHHDVVQNTNNTVGWDKNDDYNSFSNYQRRDDNRYGRRDGMDFHNQQRQQRPQQQPQPTRWSSRNDDNYDDRGRGEWRRGQTLSQSTSLDVAARRGREPNNERRVKQDQQHAPSSSSNNNNNRPAGSEGRSAVRTTFPAAPTQGAWGNNNSSRTSIKHENDGNSMQKIMESETKNASTANNDRDDKIKNPAVAKVEKRVWGKPDSVGKKHTPNAWGKPDHSAAPESSVSSSTLNSATPSPAEAANGNAKPDVPTSTNPWAKQSAAASSGKSDTTKSTIATDNSAFPAWNAGTATGGGAGAGDSHKKTTAHKMEESKFSSTPSLPSTSLWGKSASHSFATQPSKPSAGSAAAKRVVGAKEKKSKVEEFPSLSTASTKSNKPKPPTSSSALVTPAEEKSSKKGNNKGSSKKAAAPTNLASFLSPQLSGASATNKSSKKKQQSASLQKLSVSKKGMNNSSMNNHKHLQSHPGMASIAGMKRSAPTSTSTTNNDQRAAAALPNAKGTAGGGGTVTKKGRQRLAPRKKKLTTLKKRVLKERLRMWKEKNGIVDGDEDGLGTKVDANGVLDPSQGVGGNEQPNVKRLKMESAATSNPAAGRASTKSTTLLVDNFIRPQEDDLEDDDEYDELQSNLISLAGRVGKVVSVYIPRPSREDRMGQDASNSMEQEGSDVYSILPNETNHLGLAFVRYATSTDVTAAKDILEGMVVGGQKIGATVLEGEEMVPFNTNDVGTGGTVAAEVAPSAQNDRQWCLAVLSVMEKRQMSMDVSGDVQANSVFSGTSQVVGGSASASATTTIIFHKILCDDDYEDDEALQESIEDIQGLARQYGPVEGTRASTDGHDKGNVYIAFGNSDAAMRAVNQLNGLVVGGSKVAVSLYRKLPQHGEPQESGVGMVALTNVLNEDDFEDEDCFHESMADIRNLVQQYGRIGDINAELSGERRGRVCVTYLEGHTVAEQAASKLNGMVVGGLTIVASVMSQSGTQNSSNSPMDTTPNSSNVKEQEKEKISEPPPPPMYSGDKIVPERFAACKRVPKIPNPGTPRSYATKIPDERATPLLIEMLGELMRLQDRSKDDKNARARRRLVMGLREVARGIRAHKVKMVIMANNLDDYGAIDSKLQEILDLARAEDLPVLFELNKRKLGKALGKSIKVSVVGIQNADGAHEPFKKLKKIMGMA
eukprot:CAMPEP_0183746860 /NCGR_PEP_ID=MMETSP0737-20130205/66973_1 /TAXON_ID=385413 /ORGANISM="Thalassiosira miniscula, Strain CCMP1093" /LENGTH=1208 /DNA_ID=CAMNT_0025982567 /DNA_START=93 /DNA_END=3719 /DNA_ORIENTATION=-